jgi:hypothetical protein
MYKIENHKAEPGDPADRNFELIFRVESGELWRKGSEAWIEPSFIRGK